MARHARRVVTCRARRDERGALVVLVVPCLFQHEAVMLAFTSLVFCVLDLHQSQENFEKK